MSGRITSYGTLSTVRADDLLPVVDIHDTSMAATGTTKKMTLAQLGPSDWVNITAYGATGDGTTDNTTAIGNAITAAGSSGVVYIPPGTYLTGPLTVTSDLIITGAGWSSVLKLKNSSNGYVLTFSPPAGGIKADIRNLAINGNAENQASGGCIYAAGAVQSRFDNLHLYDAYDVCLWLYQISSGVIGHHNRVTRCLFDTLNTVAGANQQGIRMQSSDENYVAFCDFENWGGSTAGSEPYAIKDWSGLQVITSNVFVSGQEAVRIQDSSSTRVIGNTFDGQGRAGVHASGSKNVIMGNLFSNGSGASNGASAQLEIDNSSSMVAAGNIFAVTTSGQVRNCVYELSSSSDHSVIADNVLDLTGGTLFGGNPAIQLQGTHSAARGNGNWNPVGKIASPPAVPASTGTATNTTGADCMVYITTGSGVTVSAVLIGGQAAGPQSVAASTTTNGIRVPAGQTISLTYSGGTPAWAWFGD